MRDVYDYIVVNSETSPYGEVFPPSPMNYPVKIWRGFGATVANDLDVTVQTIYRSLRALELIGSIKKIRHGGPKFPSVYQIIKEPDGREYAAVLERSAISDRLVLPTKNSRMMDTINTLRRELDDLRHRVEILEDERDRHDV